MYRLRVETSVRKTIYFPWAIFFEEEKKKESKWLEEMKREKREK